MSEAPRRGGNRKSGYRILDHPADLGIEAWGRDISQAFGCAVEGLISVIVDPGSVEPHDARSIALEGRDHESLLVRLLSEVLYLYDGERFLTRKARISRVTETRLEAEVLGEEFDENKHHMKLDVKAITYHQLLVEKVREGVRVRVYLDI